MLGFLPTPYPDELLYSWLARYGVQSGYISYIFVAEQLFEKNTAKPSIDFLIGLTEEVLQAINRYMSLEQVIMKHTMFPMYVRFLPKERRQKAMDLLLKMDKNYYNALFVRKNKVQEHRWLRYCPCCVEEAREKYGEAYWMRKHQLIGVDVCSRHRCRLINSNVEMSSRPSPSLLDAEHEIPQEMIADYNVSKLELKIAEYMEQLFEADVDMENEILVGDFLHGQMQYTKYLSERGNVRKIALLIQDCSEYYKELANNPLEEELNVRKIFRNRNFHNYDICLMAMFLKIPVY